LDEVVDLPGRNLGDPGLLYDGDQRLLGPVGDLVTGGVGDAGRRGAASAAARGFTIATRDTSPFKAAGLNIIDPWEASQ
jgi:hypothetical protein